MTSLTAAPIVAFALRRHPRIAAGALIFLFWLIAAALVLAAHLVIEPRSAEGGAAATIGAIVLSAYAYTCFCARNCGVSHALGAGIAWLVLSIAVEIAMSTHFGRGWYALIGNPSIPLLRNFVMFLWIFAPAFFARRE